MDVPSAGESSRSPQLRVQGLDSSTDDLASSATVAMSRLILPQWDIPAPKHLHTSHDIVSLLNLESIFDTFVRPYSDPVVLPDGQSFERVKVEPNGTTAVDGEDGIDQPDGAGGGDGENAGDTKPIVPKRVGGKGHRRRMLIKGYTHLINDCIDPMPLGPKRDHVGAFSHTLGTLILDWTDPGSAPPNQVDQAVESIPPELFQNAVLKPGRIDGYSQGNKVGVAEAEEKRQRKRIRHSHSVLPDLPHPSPDPDAAASINPSPTLPSPTVPPVHPPSFPHRPSFPVNTTRRSLPPNAHRPSGSFRGRGTFNRGASVGPSGPGRGGAPASGYTNDSGQRQGGPSTPFSRGGTPRRIGFGGPPGRGAHNRSTSMGGQHRPPYSNRTPFRGGPGGGGPNVNPSRGGPHISPGRGGLPGNGPRGPRGRGGGGFGPPGGGTRGSGGRGGPGFAPGIRGRGQGGLKRPGESLGREDGIKRSRE